jgi:hypothetical protein
MRILIDECLEWRLGRALTGHECISVQKMGGDGIKNGKLLAVVVLAARSTQLAKTLPLAPALLTILPQLTPGQVIVITP